MTAKQDANIVEILLEDILLLKIYKIAKSADNLRTSIIAYGAFWYFALHIIINLLGILALIPLTGVPLPFLSYGVFLLFQILPVLIPL